MAPAERAFREELVALLPRLRRFAAALSRSADIADEVLQTALERALRNAHSFDKSRRLDSWMFKIIQNVWIDSRSEHLRRQSLSLDSIVEPAVDERGTIEARDELRRAALAFTALPEEQRAVLTLVVLDGLPYREAADALGVPIGTVMSRLARARAALLSAVRGDEALGRVRGVGHE